MSKKSIMIAGPNGAGKTTFAGAFLPWEAQCPRFINADLIAARLSPFAPEAVAIRAGRLLLEEIAACERRGDSFAFETTLAGLGYLRRIDPWRAAGYHISLYFLQLPDAETAMEDAAGEKHER
jgi:predicted ABC-type ATPase